MEQHGDNITFGNYYIIDEEQLENMLINNKLTILSATADEILLTHQESTTEPLVGIKDIASKFSETRCKCGLPKGGGVPCCNRTDCNILE